MNHEKLYDLSNLRAISRGNEDFVKKMVAVFCEQTPELFDDMQLAWQHGYDCTFHQFSLPSLLLCQ